MSQDIATAPLVARQAVITVQDDPSDADRERIYRFLASQARPTLAYDPAWMDILRDGLGHRPFYVTALDEGRVVGLLPLMRVQSPLFGKFLVSLPYLNYGGPLAADELTATRLIDRAVELADSNNVKYLELRSSQEWDHPRLTQSQNSKVVMWKKLPATTEELWKSFKPEVRNQIRKGEKAGLTVEWGSHDLLGDFYDVFSENMRDLGTPVFSRRLFESILNYLDERAELCVVRSDKTPVAAALLLHGPAFTEVPSASSLRRFNSTCSNMLMYHHLLLRAVERSQTTFDFGRSSMDGGTYRFKKQWGAEPQPSIWQYYVRHGEASQMRPDNPKYAWKIEAWKKLPLWLTRLVGPTIIRGVP